MKKALFKHQLQEQRYKENMALQAKHASETDQPIDPSHGQFFVFEDDQRWQSMVMGDLENISLADLVRGEKRLMFKLQFEDEGVLFVCSHQEDRDKLRTKYKTFHAPITILSMSDWAGLCNAGGAKEWMEMNWFDGKFIKEMSWLLDAVDGRLVDIKDLSVDQQDKV